MESARFTIPFNILTLILVLLFSSTYADVLNVPDDFETIQAAIDASEDGDTVLVAPGEYEENINFNGKDIVVIGNPDDPSEVIIDGGGEDRVVTFSQGESSDALLSGFMIMNGSANNGGGISCQNSSPTLQNLIVTENEATSSGGGLYCSGGQNFVVRDVLIEDNSANQGGGIYSRYTELELRDVIVTRNTASSMGGAAYIYGGDRVEMTNVLIAANNDDEVGGVALEFVTEVLLTKVTIVANTGTGWAQHTSGSDVRTIMSNSIVWGNTTDQIYLYIGHGERGEIRFNISYTDVHFGSMGIYTFGDGCVVNIGNGFIADDPLFVNPDEGDYHLTEDSPCIDAGDPDSDLDPDGTRADMGAFYFHQRDIEVEPDSIEFIGVQTGIVDSSAVIIRNIGLTPLQIISITIDPEDAPFEVVGEAGEFEIEPETDHQIWITFFPEDQAGYEAVLQIESDDPDEELVEIAITGTALGVEDIDATIPFEFGISSIHPNPFNSQVTIRYSLPFPTHASLIVYNTLGQRLRTLFEGYKHPGFHTVNLNADDLPSGLYFIRLEAARQVSSRKVMLVK